MSKAEKKSSVTVLTGDVRKADTKALITNGSDAFPEDTFAGSYWQAGEKSSAASELAILEPMYKPGTLCAMVVQNNVLAQCVEAMEVNIDGTGHSIDLIEGESEDETEKQLLTDFFTEPYPGKSMVGIRRSIRQDLESTGNGYMEVIRNAEDGITLLNHLASVDMRLLRLDDPVTADKVIRRGGKEITVKIRTRERRFVQMINGKKVYFKEYGASRDLDRNTGKWAENGERLPVTDRASEIIHFTGKTEPKTPYGVPRWLNQLPSVLGSRKAEEFNLEFFDAGGLPPVLVIVEGGTLGVDTTDALRNHLSAKGAGQHRAAIVEAISTSGSLDSSGSVRVRVERFGSEKQSDAMFQNYDKNCEEHIRVSFRLPPMFIGKAADFNFATAYTAYMVAEAQVFYPERDEFDISMARIVKELGVTKYKYRSLPVTLVDVDNQMKALEIVSKDQSVKAEDIVSTLNEITGLSLEYSEPPKEDKPVGKIDPLTGLPYTQPVPPQHAPVSPPKEATGPAPAVKAELVQLAAKWASVLGANGECNLSASEQDVVRRQVSSLELDELETVGNLIAASLVTKGSIEGLGDLCGCASH